MFWNGREVRRIAYRREGDTGEGQEAGAGRDPMGKAAARAGGTAEGSHLQGKSTGHGQGGMQGQVRGGTKKARNTAKRAGRTARARVEAVAGGAGGRGRGTLRQMGGGPGRPAPTA